MAGQYVTALIVLVGLYGIAGAARNFLGGPGCVDEQGCNTWDSETGACHRQWEDYL